jgi:hypothetical protein
LKNIRVRLCKLQKECTRLTATTDKLYQLPAHGQWFSPGTPVSSTTKTGRHDIAEILLKVALSTTKAKSKFLDVINLSNILHHKSVKSKIPPYVKDQSVLITYSRSIAAKIVNYVEETGVPGENHRP